MGECLCAQVPSHGNPPVWSEVPAAGLGNAHLATSAAAAAARETARKNDALTERKRHLRRFSSSVTDLVVGGGGAAPRGTPVTFDVSADAGDDVGAGDDSSDGEDDDAAYRVGGQVDAGDQAASARRRRRRFGGSDSDSDDSTAGDGRRSPVIAGQLLPSPLAAGRSRSNTASTTTSDAMAPPRPVGLPSPSGAPPVPRRTVGVPPSMGWTDDESDGADSMCGDASGEDGGAGEADGGAVGAGADQFTLVELPRGAAPTPTHPYPRGVEIPLRVEVVRVWEARAPRRRRRHRAMSAGRATSAGEAAGLSLDGLDSMSMYFANKYQVGRRTHLPNRPPSPSDSGVTSGTAGPRPVPREIADAPAQMRGTFTTRRPRRASVADFADGLGLVDWEHNPAVARGPPLVAASPESGHDDDTVMWGPAASPPRSDDSAAMPWLWDSDEERAGFEAFVAARDYIQALRRGDEAAPRDVAVPAGAMESWAAHIRARQAFDAWALGSGSGPAGAIGPQQVLAWLMTTQGTPEGAGITWEMPPGFSAPAADPSAAHSDIDQSPGAFRKLGLAGALLLT